MMKSRMNLAYAMIAILLIGGLFSACPTEPPAVQPTGTLYTVTVEQPAAGGTIDADPKSAEEGAVITLTAFPETGYVLSSYTVTTDGGDPVDLDDGTGDTRTFIMPAADVTVTANFRGENDIEHDVNITQSTGGTFTVSPDKAYVGDTVTINGTPASGKALDTVTVTKAGGETVTVTGTGNTRTFVMPDEEVTITVTWKDTGTVNPGDDTTITSGAIEIPAPEVGESVLVPGTTDYAAAGANFTALLIEVAPADAVYAGSANYTFTFELTALPGFVFADATTAITVNGKAAAYTWLDGVALVECALSTGMGEADPRSPDWIYNRGDKAVASSLNTYTGTIVGPFDGNPLHAGGVSSTYWQSAGGGEGSWLGVDLGEVKNIGSVRVTWGRGMGANGSNLDLMVNGQIQVAENDPFMSAGTYGDTGWTVAGSFANTPNTGVAGDANNQDDVNVIELAAGTRGR